MNMKMNKLCATVVAVFFVLGSLPFQSFSQSKYYLDSFAYVQHGKQKLYLDRIVSTDSTHTTNQRPVLIWLFGGGWESGTRAMNELYPFMNEFLSRKYMIVAIDYRLGVKEAKAKGLMNQKNGTQIYLKAIDMSVEDLYAATRFVIAHAAEWNIDTQQILIGGGSSGATTAIVAENGLCNNSSLSKKYLPNNFNYAGVIAMAGALWLPGESAAAVWRKKPCPFMFFIGTKDQVVTYNESHSHGFSGFGPAYLSKQLSEMEVANWFYEYIDGDHLIAGAPAINKCAEIGIFLDRFIANKNVLYYHTIENGKTPIDFLHIDSLTDDSGKGLSKGVD